MPARDVLVRTRSARWWPTLKWSARASIGATKRGNYRFAGPPQGITMTGVWACDLGILPRGRGRDGLGNCSPPPQGSGQLCAEESWRSFDPKGEVGYPPSVATDAHLGYSVICWQSGAILFGSREGDSHILMRIEGAGVRSHPGRRGAMAQRAGVGHCPLSTRPAHVAAPVRFELEVFAPKKVRGLSLLMERGPWAARFYAACVCARRRALAGSIAKNLRSRSIWRRIPFRAREKARRLQSPPACTKCIQSQIGGAPGQRCISAG